MQFRNALLCHAACVAFAGGGGATFAADMPPPTPVPTASTLGEVVVTARRREESLQKVPVAITAFSQRTLTERAIASSFDLNSAVPGLTVEADSGRGTAPIFAIRGVGQDFGAAAGSVETYFADVPLSGPFQMPHMGPTFFDLQSLQVLKGPQGTLFGRSTTGGAVLLVPQAPTDSFGGYLRVQGGDYNDFQLEGAVNLPLVADVASLRLAVFDWKRDGYGRTVAGNKDQFGNILPSQTYDNEDVQEFRATLKLTPIRGLQNSTIFSYHSDDNRNTEKATVVDPNTVLGGYINLLAPGVTNLPPHLADISTNLDKPHTINWSVINTTTYDLTPTLTLKNIFGYIDARGDTDVAADVDGTPLSFIDLPSIHRPAETWQTTDELQLQGRAFDDRLTWVVGGLIDQTRQPGGINDIGVIISVDDATPGGVNIDWQQNNFSNYGLFGSATYKFTDKFSATIGERHSWDTVHVDEYSAPMTAAQFLANPNTTVAGFLAGPSAGGVTPLQALTHSPNSASFQGDTYNLDLAYNVSDATMVYGGYRRGFKQGGFNVSFPTSDPAEQSFGPETDDDFHVGLKTGFDVVGVKGRFNIEGYWDLYHNKQESFLAETGPADNQSLATVTYNLPATTYRGIDTDIVADFTAWLQVSADYSYIDAYYTRWTDTTFASTSTTPLCMGDPTASQCIDHKLNLAINPVGFVSPNKFSLTFRFHTRLQGDRGELVFAPTVTYQDKFYTIGDSRLLPQGETAALGLPVNFNSEAAGGDFVSSYALLNLRIEWNQVWGSKINAAFNAKNLTNKTYSLGDTTSIADGVQSDSFGPPRMFTVELSTRF